MMRNSRRTISEESELVNQRKDCVTTYSSRLNANGNVIDWMVAYGFKNTIEAIHIEGG